MARCQQCFPGAICQLLDGDVGGWVLVDKIVAQFDQRCGSSRGKHKLDIRECRQQSLETASECSRCANQQNATHHLGTRRLSDETLTHMLRWDHAFATSA